MAGRGASEPTNPAESGASENGRTESGPTESGPTESARTESEASDDRPTGNAAGERAESETGKLELPGPEPDPADFERGSIFFVGNATVVLRYAGFTILTDPNFLRRGDRVHLGYGITATRRTDPAIDIADLPPIDFALLSHYHGDHFDRIAEANLDRDLPIVTTPHAAANLAELGFHRTRSLETWETLTVRKGGVRLDVTAMPGTHAHGPLSKLLPSVMGSMLEFRTDEGEAAYRLYITGDTLVHDELREVPERYPDIDLALVHLGGTKVLGALLTMDATEGFEAVELVDAETSVPIHFADYTAFKSPLADFAKRVSDAGLDDRVGYVAHGGTYTFEVPAERWA